MKNKQKYLALDIGNVLCRLDFEQYEDALHKMNSDMWPMGDPKYFNSYAKYQKTQDLGHISVKDMLTYEFSHLVTNHIDKLSERWLHTARPVSLINNLLEKISENINIALLSNIGVDHAKYLREICPIYNNFIQHFSCEVGARKPQKLFFQSFLLQYPEFKNCTFLDDSLDNLDMAKQFGFNTIYFDLSQINNDVEAVERLKAIISKYYDI